MTKLAIVSQPFDDVLPPRQNSIGIWSYEAARRLAGRCDVTVFVKRTFRAEHPRTVVDHGATYRFTRGFPSRVWDLATRLVDRRIRKLQPFYGSRLFHAEYALRVALACRRAGYDIIHIHNFTGFVPLFRRLNPKARLVLHMNGEWLSQLDHDRMDACVAQVDLVLGSSNHITNLVRQRFPHHAAKCHTVYNGVDVEAFSPRYTTADGPARGADAGTPPRLIFVGRLSPEKGLHDLVDAYALLRPRHPALELQLVGPPGVIPLEYIVGVSDDELVRGLARFYDGDYLEGLRARVPSEHVDGIEFTGARPHDEVVSRVAAADVLVNPSYSESFGMALVEAMASEVPVVATIAGGMPEIVEDGVSGRLVDRGDVPALADAIGEILADRDRAEAMGRAGRRRVVDRFSWEAVVETLWPHYQSLLAAGVRNESAPVPVPRSGG